MSAEVPRETAESVDVPGAVDVVDLHYAMAREGRVPHLFAGQVSPGGFIGQPSLCARVMVTRLAVPSDTFGGRICRWCERVEGQKGARR